MECTDLIVVTGGAGFIGSNFILQRMRDESASLVNLDKLTYAGNPDNLESIADNPRYQFVQGDIVDRELVRKTSGAPSAARHRALRRRKPRRPLDPRPGRFRPDQRRRHVHAAGRGASVLERACGEAERSAFRFLHVSTDEVYGSLGPTIRRFPRPRRTRRTARMRRRRRLGSPGARLSPHLRPADADHQLLEQLRPVPVSRKADSADDSRMRSQGKPLPVYGDGKNVRDWLYVGDHCAAIRAVLARGQPGETYNIGGRTRSRTSRSCRRSAICWMSCAPANGRFTARADHVCERSSRPRPALRDRCAQDRARTGWKPQETFETGLRKTVAGIWRTRRGCDDVTSGSYRQWIATHYAGESTIMN